MDQYQDISGHIDIVLERQHQFEMQKLSFIITMNTHEFSPGLMLDGRTVHLLPERGLI